MSEYIYATITRGTSTIAQRCYTQVDKVQGMEAAQYEGSDPHFVYKMFTIQLPVQNVQLIRQGDYVIDPSVIDPKTNAARKYLIISDPEPNVLNMSWRWMTERMRGT